MLPFTCHFCLEDGHPPSCHPPDLSEVLLPRGVGGVGKFLGPLVGAMTFPCLCVRGILYSFTVFMALERACPGSEPLPRWP